HPRPEAEVAVLERGVLRSALACPVLGAARFVELGRIALLQELPVAVYFLQGVLLSRGKARQARREHPGQDALNTHGSVPRGVVPRRASAAGDDRLVASLFAFIVEPGDRHSLAGLAAFEAEMQERIARNRGSPLRRQHGPAAVRYG